MSGKVLLLVLLQMSFVLAQGLEPVPEKLVVRKARSLDELVQAVEEADETLYSGDFNRRREILFRRDFLKSWTQEELEIYANGPPGGVYTEWMFPMAEQSAFYVHSGQIEFFKDFDNDLKAIQEEAGRGLEGNSAEVRSEFYWSSAEAALAGWSRPDPRAAWRSVSHPDGELYGLRILKYYGYLAPRSIFENLVKADPGLVWSEFANESDLLRRESMLIGVYYGSPKNFDWREIYQKILDAANPPPPEYSWILRVQMLSKWMEVDAVAAEKWFRSEEGKAVSLEERSLFEDSNFLHFLTGGRYPDGLRYKRPASLAPAVVYWMGRDLDGGMAWLLNRPEVLKELFADHLHEVDGILTPKNLRKILKECFSIEEREVVLEPLISVEDDLFLGDHLRAFFDCETERALSNSIDELNVDEKLGDRIFTELR